MHIEKGNTHNNDVIVLNFIFFLCLICFDLDILNLPCTLTNHLMLCPRLHKVISTFYVDQSSFNYLFFLKKSSLLREFKPTSQTQPKIVRQQV